MKEALPPHEKLRAALNDKADLGAKAAAAEVLPDKWRVQLAQDKLHRAKRALEFVAHFRVSLAEEGVLTNDFVQQPRGRRRGPLQKRKPPECPHKLFKEGPYKFRCIHCPAWAKTAWGYKQLRKQECWGDKAILKRLAKGPAPKDPHQRQPAQEQVQGQGPPSCEGSSTSTGCAGLPEASTADQAASQRARGLGHVPWLAGDVVFCWKCGAYSRERGAALKRQCPGGPNSSTVLYRLKRLKEGRHPLSKEVLGQPRPLGSLAAER